MQSMSWVHWAWPILASASLTLGLIHGLVWFRRRDMRQHLAFSIAAIVVAALTMMELVAMRSLDPEAFARTLRWMHVPLAVLVAALVAFMRLSFGAGYFALGLAAVGLRVVALVPNFTSGANLNFMQVDAMGLVRWGESAWVSYPIGQPNPWVLLAQASNLLLIAYVVMVMRATLRSGDELLRRRAAIVCIGWLIFIGVMVAASVMMTLNMGRMPFVGTPSFVIVIVAMSYQLGGSLLDADHLAARLHDRELDVEMAADAAALGLWSWDIADDRIEGSAKALELLGGREDGNAMRLADLIARIHPEDRIGLRVSLDQALQSGVLSASFRVARCDADAWLSVSGRVETDAHGNPRFMRGVAIDSSGIHMSEEHVRTLLESAPIALVLADASGSVCLLNSEAERIFGYTRDEVIGAPLVRLLPRVKGPGVLASPKSPRSEAKGIRSDASEFPVDIRVKPVTFGQQGTFDLVAVTDLSESRRKDEELQLRNDEVTHLSRVTLLGQLSGSLAHELNQPLTAILSNAQAAQRMLARDPGRGAELQDILSDIVESGRRAGDVISNLRAMLRKEACPRALLDVNEVVRDSLRLVRSEVRDRGVIVLLDLMPDGTRVEGDRVPLQQVLLNLMLNGCDAMADSHTRRLTVRTSVVDGLARISVLDEGVGISPGMIERMFLPFETTKAGGMGIGLAVCRTIAESHQARLWAENLPEGGAGFHFDLPLASADQPGASCARG